MIVGVVCEDKKLGSTMWLWIYKSLSFDYFNRKKKKKKLLGLLVKY